MGMFLPQILLQDGKQFDIVKMFDQIQDSIRDLIAGLGAVSFVSDL